MVLSRTDLDRNQKISEIAKLILCEVKTDIFDQVRSGAFRIDAATRERLITRTLPAFQAALDAKENAIRRFEAGLEELSYKPVLTLAYTSKRDPTASDYSVFRLLFQKKQPRVEGLWKILSKDSKWNILYCSADAQKR